jgi:hypothetical protein
MHNLHFVICSAPDVTDAALAVDSYLEGYGSEDNWYNVGGVVSEDGTEELDNYSDNARWDLSHLREKAHSGPVLSNLYDVAMREVQKEFSPNRANNDKKELLKKVTDIVLGDDTSDMEFYSCQELLKSIEASVNQSFNDHVFDDYGLTDISEDHSGDKNDKKYIVMIDMHS